MCIYNSKFFSLPPPRVASAPAYLAARPSPRFCELNVPRNPQPRRLYGMSPVERVALTINIALRRDRATLDYYHTASTPEAFATMLKHWTIGQIVQLCLQQSDLEFCWVGDDAAAMTRNSVPIGFIRPLLLP